MTGEGRSRRLTYQTRVNGDVPDLLDGNNGAGQGGFIPPGFPRAARSSPARPRHRAEDTPEIDGRMIELYGIHA